MNIPKTKDEYLKMLKMAFLEGQRSIEEDLEIWNPMVRSTPNINLKRGLIRNGSMIKINFIKQIIMSLTYKAMHSNFNDLKTKIC